jgi:hypothetical protein
MPLLETAVMEIGYSIAKSIMKSWLKDFPPNDPEQVRNKLVEAKKEYDDAQKDPTSPIEQKRDFLLIKLSELQTQTMIYVTNELLLAKILPLILDQTAEVYKAHSVQDLKIIELNMGQVQGAIKQYQAIATQRVIARWLAVVVSVLAIAGMGGLIYWSAVGNGPNVNTILPVLQIPLPILIWSALGSFVAILYRFNNYGDIALQDPLRWLFTRPLTGIMMGIIAYFVVSIGLLSIGFKNPSSSGSQEIFWLIAFIGGFSDRFADSLLRSLVGHFGGKADADLVTLDNLSASANLSSLVESLPAIKNWKERQVIVQEKDAEKNRGSIDQSQQLAQGTTASSEPVKSDYETTDLKASQSGGHNAQTNGNADHEQTN